MALGRVEHRLDELFVVRHRVRPQPSKCVRQSVPRCCCHEPHPVVIGRRQSADEIAATQLRTQIVWHQKTRESA